MRNKLLPQRDLPDTAFKQVLIHTFRINFIIRKLAYDTKTSGDIHKKINGRENVFLNNNAISWAVFVSSKRPPWFDCSGLVTNCSSIVHFQTAVSNKHASTSSAPRVCDFTKCNAKTWKLPRSLWQHTERSSEPDTY